MPLFSSLNTPICGTNNAIVHNDGQLEKALFFFLLFFLFLGLVCRRRMRSPLAMLGCVPLVLVPCVRSWLPSGSPLLTRSTLISAWKRDCDHHKVWYEISNAVQKLNCAAVDNCERIFLRAICALTHVGLRLTRANKNALVKVSFYSITHEACLFTLFAVNHIMIHLPKPTGLFRKPSINGYQWNRTAPKHAKKNKNNIHTEEISEHISCDILTIVPTDVMTPLK